MILITNDDFHENGAIICDQKVVSNKLNNYFVNTAQDLLRELGEPNNRSQDYLKDPNHSFFLKEKTAYEKQKLLNNMNARKAIEICGISPEPMKTLSDHI